MISLPCPSTTELTVEQILDVLGTAGSVLPVAAMEAALERWDEVLPAAIELFSSQETFGAADYDPRFLLIHMAGEKCDPRAHRPICRMIIESKDLESVIGGTITEGLRGILINTFDGDPASLQAVVEEEKADEYARAQALGALAYLSAHGRLAGLDMRAYLTSLAEVLKPKSYNYVWEAWAESIAQLGYRELLPAIENAFFEEFLDDHCFGFGEMVELLELSETDGAKAALAHDGIEPYGQAIETLSDWYCFSRRAQELERRHALGLEGPPVDHHESLFRPNSTAKNPLRDVGRNDSCPCGSGKKFKKCCISFA